MVVSHHVVSGNSGPLEEQSVLLTTEPCHTSCLVGLLVGLPYVSYLQRPRNEAVLLWLDRKGHGSCGFVIEWYHETCLFAYCVGATAGNGPEGQLEAVCATFANYAQACARQHIYVHWRKPGFCGMLALPIPNQSRSLSDLRASWLPPMACWICKANSS